MKKKIKNLKPIECDIHLKYRCPCGELHWLSYEEACEPDFIIVCECKTILKVKPISSIVIKYKTDTKQDKSAVRTSEVIEQNQSHTNNKNESETPIEPVVISSDTENNIEDKVIIKNQVEETETIPSDLINTCSNLLVTFGYNKKEALLLVNDFYRQNPAIKYSVFVKMLLKSLGEKNNELNFTTN